MAKQKFIISDETENTYGFTFLNSELDFSRFNKNPICLYMHEKEKVIVGSWSAPVLEEVEGVECWTSELTFDSEDEKVKPIEGKVKRGFLKAVSLGAMVKGGFEQKGDKVYAKGGVVVEISLVNIGSNANAVKLYHSDGKVMEDTEVKLSLQFEDNQNQKTNMAELKNVAVTLGLSETASEQEVTTAIVNLKAETGYKQKFEDLEKTVAEGKKKDFVDAVELKIAEKALSATDKQDYLDLYELSAEKAEKMLAKLQAPQNLAQVAGSGSGNTVNLSAEYDKLETENGLVTLMAQNPTRFKELYKAKFGVEPAL
jgi:hypothetical protein